MVKESFTMFHTFRYFLFVVCTFKPCIAELHTFDLKNCKEERHKSKICLTSENGYFKPFPVIVNSDLVLKNIRKIDENEKAISAQFELSTLWEDPGVALSNISLM